MYAIIGCIQTDVNEGDQKKLCLNEEQTLRLARIGVRLEQLYDSSRDIEWALLEVHA